MSHLACTANFSISYFHLQLSFAPKLPPLERCSTEAEISCAMLTRLYLCLSDRYIQLRQLTCKHFPRALRTLYPCRRKPDLRPTTVTSVVGGGLHQTSRFCRNPHNPNRETKCLLGSEAGAVFPKLLHPTLNQGPV